MPYSQYSYVKPAYDVKMDTFIRCHIRMYEYFEGVATGLVCDNLKTGAVTHPKEDEIILAADYEVLGQHYMTVIMSAQVKKSEQKTSVEGTVDKVAVAIIAKPRNDVFYSFEDLKAVVTKEFYEFNHENSQKREGSRYDAFLGEKEYLHALPEIPYEIATRVCDRAVNLDFHVVFEENRYSCPYQYVRKAVDLRVTDTTIEIYRKDNRIATHNRFTAGRKNQYSTHPEDTPEQFKVTPWDDERIKNWAAAIGPYTTRTINHIFDGVSIKGQDYNPSLAVLRLSKTYSEARLETVCEFAIIKGIRKPRYHHLEPILAANQDKMYLDSRQSDRPDDDSMGYLRGSDYYD